MRALTAYVRGAYGANTLSSRFPIPSGFWTDHFREHALDEPAVVRTPFSVSLLTPIDIFETLVTAADAERAGRPCGLRLYLGDRESVRRQMIDDLGAAYRDMLPRSEDHSLHGYGERLKQRYGHECFGLLLNESQSLIPEIWFRVRDFLRGLYDEVGFPAGGADANIFAGNYGRTPFGVHTDERDVFTWIVEGHKKFLVWPRERLDGVMGPGLRDAHDYADLRPSAIALEGDAGDLLYWPHPFWHVAEAERDGFVTTLSIGLDRTMPAETWMKEALFGLVRDTLLSGERITHHAFESRRLGRSIRALPSQLARALKAHQRRSPELERELRLKWMCWLTGFGMKTPPRAPPIELANADRVRCDSEHPIVCTAWRDELLCSANGYGFTVPRTLQCAALVREINSARELSVADLRRRFAKLRHLDAMLEAFVSFRALRHIPKAE